MNQIRKILKEELSKRDQLKARVKSIFLEEVAEGNPSITTVEDMGFDYPGMEEDLKEIAIEWANEGLQRLKAITPTSNAEATFIKLFDGVYADAWFEKYPHSIFFFKGNQTNPEFWFGLESSNFWCSNIRVWRIFSKEYSLEYEDIQQLIKTIAEEAFRLRGVIPDVPSLRYVLPVEKAFRIKNR